MHLLHFQAEIGVVWAAGAHLWDFWNLRILVVGREKKGEKREYIWWWFHSGIIIIIIRVGRYPGRAHGSYTLPKILSNFAALYYTVNFSLIDVKNKHRMQESCASQLSLEKKLI